MLDKEKISTGFHSVTGEKIYLGDKIRQFIIGDMSTAFVVMYDDSEQNYVMIPIGRNSKNGLYRKYPLKGNLDSPHSKFHVAGNVVFLIRPILEIK
ncbi:MULTISPECIES: hypothetical protein [Flavobacterium]|uniref:hypothetical protein n=1 Tax=Flavobacterium TaxID=237 RepID=UPI001FCAC65D|nr:MULTISPECIES: hypothetical protein [Flavobacterium]UOK43637.1 hypothetical protein LZF87_05840 [Flavobacterium enshiense]